MSTAGHTLPVNVNDMAVVHFAVLHAPDRFFCADAESQDVEVEDSLPVFRGAICITNLQ